MQIAMRLAIHLGLAMCNVAQAQATEMIRLADIAHCGVFWSKPEALALIESERVKWTGKGPCVGGVAEGLWTLRRDSSTLILDKIRPMGWSEKLAHFHAGRPFGWIRTVNVQENHDRDVDLSGEDKPIEWVRQIAMIQIESDGVGRMLSEGVWGVRYSEQDLTQRRWPDFSGKFSPLNLHGQGMGAIIPDALFSKTSCAIEKGMYPECGFEPGKANFHIYFFMGPATGAARAGDRTYCPNPRQFSSCVAMGEAIAAPIRANLQATVERLRDSITTQFQRMDETLAAGTSAGQATPSAAAAPDLDALPVGGLYAAADEALQRGDKPAAKAALRALLRRFPEHPLAVVAAQQLGQL